MSPRQKRMRRIRVKAANKRLHVFKLDNHTCVYCGIKVLFGMGTIDHLHPVSTLLEFPHSYINRIENLVTACFKCNQRLQNTPFTLKAPRYGRFVAATLEGQVWDNQ